MERWWGVVFFALAACEPEPKGPVQVQQPEAMHFETEKLRREVDRYREVPSAKEQKRMEGMFAVLDGKVRELEALAATQSGTERTSTEMQIADLKRRRELHWMRAQNPIVETESIQKAEPVAERTVKAERVNGARARRAERISAQRQMQREAQWQQRNAQMNFFQRFFR